MARQARLSLPGHAHHVLIRGHNRQSIAEDDADRGRILLLLAELAAEHRLAVHGYGLMPDHLSLLVTPSSDSGVGQAVQSLGRRYVAAFNLRHGRTGALWEGRYRSNLVGPTMQLACMRFIELAAVRAGLASGLLDWPWSSAAHHLGARRDPLIAEPAAYWQLGNTPFDREAAYRDWLDAGVAPPEAQLITDALRGGRPLGNGAYLAELEKLLGRSLAPRPRGRPRKPGTLAA